jgi:hypothetical protein
LWGGAQLFRVFFFGGDLEGDLNAKNRDAACKSNP